MNNGFSQLITGRIIDRNTSKPIANCSIVVPGSVNGIQTDSTGLFKFELNGEDKLRLTSFGYADHHIIDLNVSDSSLYLGDIALLEFEGGSYVMYERRKRFSLRRTYYCEYVPGRLIEDADLIVKCPDGLVNYTWTKVDERTLQVDAAELGKCIAH